MIFWWKKCFHDFLMIFWHFLIFSDGFLIFSDIFWWFSDRSERLCMLLVSQDKQNMKTLHRTIRGVTIRRAGRRVGCRKWLLKWNFMIFVRKLWFSDRFLISNYQISRFFPTSSLVAMTRKFKYRFFMIISALENYDFWTF